MNDNEVSLTIRGSVFKNWTSFTITSELNTISPAFSVGVVTKEKTLITKLSVGKDVIVKIGENIVLTGYVEQTPVSYSATSANIGIAGRSKTCDLIDCTVMIKSDDILCCSSSSKDLVKASDVASTEFKNTSIEDIIKKLIAPYGISLVKQIKIEENKPDPLVNKINFSAKNEDTVLKALQNLTSSANLLFYGNEKGELVVTDKGYLSAEDSLELGKNVISGSANFDATKIFKYYRVVGQGKGATGNTGSAVSTYNYIAEDNSIIKRTRLLTSKIEGSAALEKCETTAKGDRDYAKSQFYKITYKVQGWRQSNGDLWQINSIVSIKDDFLGINNNLKDKKNEVKFLITRVVFNLSESEGMTTTIDVVPPSGWRLKTEKDKEDVKKVIKSKLEDDSIAQFSWLNHKKEYA